MLENFFKNFTENSKDLIEKGYFIVDTEDIEDLENIRKSFLGYLKDSCDIDITEKQLEFLHEKVSVSDINDIRYGFYKHINSLEEDFALRYLNLAKDSVIEVAGSELASNKNVNCLFCWLNYRIRIMVFFNAIAYNFFMLFCFQN